MPLKNKNKKNNKKQKKILSIQMPHLQIFLKKICRKKIIYIFQKFSGFRKKFVNKNAIKHEISTFPLFGRFWPILKPLLADFGFGDLGSIA